MLNTIQDAISSRFKTTDLGTASWILSIRAHHDIAAGTLFIDQSQYLKTVLSRFGMSDCTPVAIPLPASKNFTPASSSEHASVSCYPYLEVIGSLTYATMGTRPDICAAVCTLSPFAATFGPVHVDGLKHIM